MKSITDLKSEAVSFIARKEQSDLINDVPALIAKFAYFQLGNQRCEDELNYVLDFIKLCERPFEDYKMLPYYEDNNPLPKDFDGQNCTYLNSHIGTPTVDYVMRQLVLRGVVKDFHLSPNFQTVIIYTFKK